MITIKDIYDLLRVTGQVAGAEFEKDPGVAARVVQGFFNGPNDWRAIYKGLQGYLNKGKELPIAINPELLNIFNVSADYDIDKDSGDVLTGIIKTINPVIKGADTSLNAKAPASTSGGTTQVNPGGGGLTGGQNLTQDDVNTILNTQTDQDKALSELLAGSGLSQEQIDVIKKLYDTVSIQDQVTAERFTQALDTAKAISDPYLKAQIAMVSDSLTRGLASIEGELQTTETKISNSLKDIQEDLANSTQFLTLEQQSELKALTRNYDEQLKNVRQDMAARGFTQSTRRAETEELLNETTGALRETTERRFGQKISQLETTAGRSERDIQLEAERLREVAKEQKVGLLREAESTLGTSNLPNTGLAPLGGQPGSIPQKQFEDVTTGALGLIF